MSFFDFLKKEGQCEKCQKTLPKKELNEFDSTVRDEVPNGEIKKLCRSCLMDELLQYLKNFNHRAVMVYPLKDLDGMAYQFYPFHEMLEYDWSQKEIDEYEKFLPPHDAKCKECSNEASFNWCSPEIYFNDPFSLKVNTEGHFPQEFLCAECLVKKFRNKIEKENITFNVEFWPPYDSDGFGTSFEA